MIGQVWDKLVRDITELIDKFRTVTNYILQNRDIDAISGLQQGIIDFGNMLEETYKLQNTKIIGLLEKFCEDLYVYASNGKEDCGNVLLEDVEQIIPVLKESIEIKDVPLAITAIVKNEGKYIIEWLEYHLLVGVEHFYIYDNESTDNLYGLLKDYIDKGIVTYHYWPGRVQQLATYNHAIDHYKYDVKYMAFIDADEFIVPVSGEQIPDIIDNILENHFGFPANGIAAGIGVNWRTYGTSFHKTAAEGLITKNYTYRGADLSWKNICIKTICDPRKVVGFSKNPHEVDYIGEYHSISENGSYIKGPWFHDSICNKLRINHYFSKSTEELLQRISKGKADSNVVYTKEMIERSLEQAEVECNKVYDFIMEKYVDELEKRVQNSIELID